MFSADTIEAGTGDYCTCRSQTVNIHCSRDPKKGIVNNQIIDWSFKLDGIMHNASQETVFSTTTTDVVTAALEGYNGMLCFTSAKEVMAYAFFSFLSISRVMQKRSG